MCKVINLNMYFETERESGDGGCCVISILTPLY